MFLTEFDKTTYARLYFLSLISGYRAMTNGKCIFIIYLGKKETQVQIFKY